MKDKRWQGSKKKARREGFLEREEKRKASKDKE